MTRTILHAQYKNIQQQYAQLTTTQDRRAFCRQNAIHVGAMKMTAYDRLINASLS